jgi:site-specific recombinase XerD
VTVALSIAGEYERLESLVLDAVHSPHTRRAYKRALRTFVEWYGSARPGPLSKAVLQQYRAQLEAAGKAGSTINQHLAALRKLVLEAADNGLLDREIASAAGRVKGAVILGVRAGNWLDGEQVKRLLAVPNLDTLKGRRDRALLAVLVGCGLRREEVSRLRVEDLEQREGHWVIPHLRGKGNRVRLVPVPDEVKDALDLWTTSGGIREKHIFRSVRKGGAVLGDRLSVKGIWKIVQTTARAAGIAEKLAPHDLRRTCAKLCDAAGGDLVQIQMLLGHSSAEITRRYIGGGQHIRNAVNDAIFKWK